MEKSEWENLEQTRAKNAFNACQDQKFAGTDGGEIVKKLPPQIRENGFLGALAFALEPRNNGKEDDASLVFDIIARHLNQLGKVKSSSAQELQKELLDSSSVKLRDVTAETMLFLNYMRRFARKRK
ncbi:MAG: type III-B CRISPR module-associated protein Cmr5 [Victivallaceae bacterium]|nr:type III-B CRISPR module-associated protein Cmr5 [Victivallaceae bacterium]